MRTALRHATLLLPIALGSLSCAGGRGDTTSTAQDTTPATDANTMELRTLEIHTLSGRPTTLDAYEGRALLVVNVASRCGLTPQYTGLQELQETYGERGLTVVGFPCNQFGGQEPGTPEEIQAFCDESYGVAFPLMEKVDVNGPNRHAIYVRLTEVPDASGEAGDVQWNFEKFVIAADGETITRFRPRTTPDDPELVAAIEAALPQG